MLRDRNRYQQLRMDLREPPVSPTIEGLRALPRFGFATKRREAIQTTPTETHELRFSMTHRYEQDLGGFMTDAHLERGPDETRQLESATTTLRLAVHGGDQTDWLEIRKEPFMKDAIEFINIWDEEFARALDDNQIAWQYKPRTFAVEWDEEGNFLDSFTPDFYLPELNVFVALVVPGYGLSGDKARKV